MNRTRRRELRQAVDEVDVLSDLERQLIVARGSYDHTSSAIMLEQSNRYLEDLFDRIDWQLGDHHIECSSKLCGPID